MWTLDLFLFYSLSLLMHTDEHTVVTEEERKKIPVARLNEQVHYKIKYYMNVFM